MNEGACLIVDVDPARLHRRVEHRYLDEVADNLDDADRQGRWPPSASGARWSVGVVGNAAEVFPELLRRGVPIDIVTDQTSAPRPAVLPARGHRARGLGRATPRRSPRTSPTGPAPRWPSTSRRWSSSRTPAPRSSTTATRSATRPARVATTARSSSPASCRPTSVRCSARARARSAGRRSRATRSDIAATDKAVLDLFPDNDRLHKWIRGAQERIAFQGLPARICWLG